MCSGLDAYFNSAVATSAMLHCVTDPKKIERCYLSLLAVPGSIIFHESKGLKECYYVISSTLHGVVAWRATARCIKGQRFVELIPKKIEEAWTYIHLYVIEGWKVQAVVEAPPGLSALSDNEDAHYDIRVTVPGEIASSLVIYSMEECVRGFTVPFPKI